MALIVQKYGGTSLANAHCIKEVAKKIIATRKGDTEENDVVVVVSAMSGDTDRLINLAKSIQPNPDPREYSALVSTGEQTSMALLTMALLEQGCSAKSYTGNQIKIFTEGPYNNGRIHHIEAEKILNDLNAGRVVIIAGFQGVDSEGNITTIGRGGSDTTAVALAAVLNASECQIYTDVDGVFTADPGIVSDARLIPEISFVEMVELASLGAKVLQNRSVEFAGKYKIPLRVLSTFNEGAGTLVRLPEENLPHHDDTIQPMEQPSVSGITYNRHEAKFTIIGIPDEPDAPYQVLGPIGAANIRVDMIAHNGSSSSKELTFTVHRDDYQKTLKLLDALMPNLGAKEILSDNKITKLSIVGFGILSDSSIASKMFYSLANEGIKIYNVAASELKVSVVIDEKYLELGVRTLHAAFNLQNKASEEFAKEE